MSIERGPNGASRVFELSSRRCHGRLREVVRAPGWCRVFVFLVLRQTAGVCVETGVGLLNMGDLFAVYSAPFMQNEELLPSEGFERYSMCPFCSFNAVV